MGQLNSAPVTALRCSACDDPVAVISDPGALIVDPAAFARDHARCLNEIPLEIRQLGPADRRRVLIRQALHRAHASPHGLLRPLSEEEVEYLLTPLLGLVEDLGESAERFTNSWQPARPAVEPYSDDTSRQSDVEDPSVELLVLRHRRDLPDERHQWQCGACAKRVQWIAGAAAAVLDHVEVGRTSMTVWLSGYCREHAAEVRAELESAAATGAPSLSIVETAIRPAQVRGWVGRMRRQIPDAPAPHE